VTLQRRGRCYFGAGTLPRSDRAGPRLYR
jgi:hypothetical protein